MIHKDGLRYRTHRRFQFENVCTRQKTREKTNLERNVYLSKALAPSMRGPSPAEEVVFPVVTRHFFLGRVELRRR